MNIWLLQTGEPYPFQENVSLMRTALLAEELHRRGHQVTWWGSTFYHQRKQMLYSEDSNIRWKDNYFIKLLHGGSYQSNKSVKRYLYHKTIASRFVQIARSQNKPNIILASLPAHDLAFEAVRYAHEIDVPVVIDVRDLWPDFFVEHSPRLMRPMVRLVLTSDFHKAAEALIGATGIVAISESYLKWALAYAKRDKTEKERIFYIGSQTIVVKKGANDRIVRTKKNYLIPPGSVILTFIGSFGETYDLFTLVATARKLYDQGRRDIHFVLGGDGQYYQSIKALAHGLPNVTLTGWLNHEQIVSLLQASDVGLAPYRTNAPQSLPNKTFQYAAAGIPVVSSLKGELADIIHRFRIGAVYTPGDSSSFLNAVTALVGNREQREEMGRNALNLFKDRFDAQMIYRKYADYLETMKG